MPGSLTFHNNPPSASRPRHRNRHVSSQLAVDSQGREHLIMNFFVRCSPSGTIREDEGYVDRAWAKLQALNEHTWTFDEVSTWTTHAYRSAVEKARRLFWYLSGEPGSTYSPPSHSFPHHTTRKETHIGRSSHEEEEKGGFWSSVTGLFSGLGRGLSSGTGEASGLGGVRWDGLTFEEAEVHCDLVKDESGNFAWRYILVDMPGS